MSEEESFRLVRDGDGHWYIIPDRELNNFVKWLRCMADDSDDSLRLLAELEDFETMRVDGPESFTFNNYTEDGNADE